MSLILSGTDGLSDVDGSAATPAIRGTDANTGIFFGADIIGFAEGGAEVARFNADAQFVAAAGTASLPVITTTGDVNTGIFFPAADTVGVSTGGSERMRIDSSGNVGIGTSSPASRLNIATGASTSCTMRFTANNTGTGAGDRGRLDFYSADNSGTAYQLGYMDYDRADGTGTASYIAWASRVSGTVAERMRIDSSGNLLVGTTSQYGSERLRVYQSGDSDTANISNASSNGAYPLTVSNRGTTNDRRLINFRQGSSETNCGAIYYNGSATVYATSSDYRLKEDIQDLTGALDSVSRLKPRAYKWKDGQIDDTGFIAHELAEVFPKAVQGEKDAVDAEGNPQYQGIDTSFLVATLTAAIQELKALTDTQASTITAMTARITALESK